MHANPPPAEPRPLKLGSHLLVMVIVVGVVGAAGAAWWRGFSPFGPVLVAARDLPAYVPVGVGDFKVEHRLKVAFGSNVVSGAEQVDRRYTLAPLARGAVVHEDALGPALADPKEFSWTVVLGVSLPRAPALEGTLRPGDRVDLAFPPPAAGGKSPPGPCQFDNLFVVDVRPRPDARKPAEGSYTVVLAVPTPRRAEFAACQASGSPLVGRRLPAP